VTRYIIRRVLGAIPLLLAVATLIFIVIDLAPGDPAAVYFNPNVPPEVIEQLRRNMGLDEPLATRYVKWLGTFLRGDFGVSFTQSRPVAAIIGDALPNTLILAVASLGAMFLIGIVVGVLQAVRQHGWADRILSVLGLFFYSMPSFWLGLMLMLLFSYKAHQWGWPLAFPATGITSVDYEFLSTWGKITDRLAHLVLPATTLVLVLAAGVARYTRGQMLEVVRQDYIRTARAKGLPERTVVLKHALRNSLIPVVTLAGLYLPLLFSGTVFVETIFSWPGMGRVIFDAISQRDMPVILATSFIFATLVVLGNLLADVLYAVVDPRIRYD
jgi:peptide/nickel transport system permease protein